MAAGKRIGESSKRNSAEFQNLRDRIKSAEGTVASIDKSIGILDDRIESQTAAVTESSASIEEMAASIQNVAAIAERESGRSRELVELVGKGQSAQQILEESVRIVVEKFSAIQEVLIVIEGIAGSTNMLAMNAAIEAAHAGEAGKGFAVVSDEIRRLAESTGENARIITSSIKEMLESINVSLSSSVTSTSVFGEFSSRVNNFIAAFGEISSAMAEISSGTDQTLQGVSELRNSAQEIQQTSGALQADSDSIRLAIGEISRAIDDAVTDYAGMEHGILAIEKAQEEIDQLIEKNSGISQELMKQVSFFKIAN
jgi:methyl-accepting chemotaxis protein